MSRPPGDAHATITCPGCEKPVSGEPGICAHCGQALLHTCACGASWHLARLKCPECGKEHSFRRRVSRPFLARKRVRILGLLLVLLILAAVNVVLIVSQSPKRRKHQILMDGYSSFDRGEYADAVIYLRKYLDMDHESADAWFMLGQALNREDNLDGAIEAWVKSADYRPDFNLAHVALANAYRVKNEYRDSLRHAELALASQPVPAEAHVAMGATMLALRNPEGAIKAYNEAVLKNPGDIETLLRLGDLHAHRERRGLEDAGRKLAQSRYEQARKLAEASLERNPGSTAGMLWFAKACAGLGHYARAATQVEALIEAEPDNAAYRRLLAGILVAHRRPEEAVKVLREALERGTADAPQFAIDLAGVLGEGLDREEEAVAVLERTIEEHEEDVALHITLVSRLASGDDPAAARSRMDAALLRFPGNPAVVEASGDFALTEGEQEVAARAYRESLSLRPQNLSARRKLVALLLPEVEKHGSEIREHIAFFLDEESGLDPNDLLARSWKARLAYAEGDFETASQILGRLEDVSLTSYEGLRILGLSRLQSGDYPGAASALLRALEHADAPRSSDDFGLAYSAAFRAGIHSRQVQLCWSALEQWPGSVVWRLRLAGALLRTNRHRDGLRECEKAKELLAGTSSVEPWLLSARIHQSMGDNAAARRELEDAVAIRRDAETRGALYAFFAATGESRLAEAGFEALLAESPGDTSVAIRYGDFLYSRSRRPDLTPLRARMLRKDALAQYEKALAADPGSRAARRRVAELRMTEASSEGESLAAAEAAVQSISDARDPNLLYFKGKIQILKGEFEAARESLGEYVRQVSGDPAGYYYFGIALRRSGEYDRAKAQFHAAIQLDPEMVEAKLELATLLFGEGMRARWHGDFEGARSAFEAILGMDADEPETRRFLAEAYARLGMSEEAIETAEMVLSVKPDDPGALFLSGLLMARKGELGPAVERFSRLVELDPESPWGRMYLGMALADSGQHDRAREHLRLAYEDKEGRKSEDVLRAIVVNEVAAGNAAEVVHLVEREREQDRKRGAVHRLLGWLYLKLNRTEDAAGAYRAAFSTDNGDVVSLALAGAILADEGRLDEAITLLDEGAVQADNPARLLLLKGRMLAGKGEVGQAVTAFRQAVIADPELVESYRELGLTLVADGSTVEGEEVLLQGIKRGLDDPEVEFRLAAVAAERGAGDVAARHYRNVLRKLPDEVAALNNLANLLAEAEEVPEEALKLARRARALSPGEPSVADTLGWVLYRRAEFEEAMPLLLEAAAGLDRDPLVLFHAGMACFRSYRWEDAARFLEASLELSPRHAGSEEARRALGEMK